MCERWEEGTWEGKRMRERWEEDTGKTGRDVGYGERMCERGGEDA